MAQDQFVTLRLPRHERRKLTLRLQGWIDGTVNRVEEVVAEYAEKIWEEAQKKVPVDTGNLRSTIEIRLTKSVFRGIRAKVGTDKTKYAIHVEYGTQKMDAQPYMRPAFEKYRDAFIEEITKILNRSHI